jgi:hypothetical protein
MEKLSMLSTAFAFVVVAHAAHCRRDSHRSFISRVFSSDDGLISEGLQ